MTTRYVGIGGSDANNGLTWTTRKLTLNGVEDTPVVAGDMVYVGPGTYRELLTVDVSGAAGNPITYIGDYLGTSTDGVGGVVRITGSNNDQTATRTNCITATSKNYRTFTGFKMDITSQHIVNLATCQNWTIKKCHLDYAPAGNFTVNCTGATQLDITIDSCYIRVSKNAAAILFSHSSTVDNSGHVVSNCIIFGGRVSSTDGLRIARVGGVTVRNCLIDNCDGGVNVVTALSVGQVATVNNCIIQWCTIGVKATTTAEFVENYNDFYANGADRSNVTTGANSLTHPPLFDVRWFFQMVYAGAGPNHAKQLISPFDLGSFSAILNVAGTSPTTTDMRGTAVQGAQREWGALEYDSTLKIAGGGSGISRARVQG